MNDWTADDLPRVLALIQKAIATPDQDEFAQVMQELRHVLREHVRRIRSMAAQRRSPKTVEDDSPQEHYRHSKS